MSSKLRIIFGTDLFYPHLSGGVIHLINVANELSRLGHEVIIIHGVRKDYKNNINVPLERNVKVYHTCHKYPYSGTISSFPIIIEMKKLVEELIKKFDIDVLLPIHYRPLYPFYIVSKKNNIPCIAIWHHTSLIGKWFGLEGWLSYEGGILKSIIGWFQEMVSIKLEYDGIFTVSKTSKSELSKFAPSDKIFIVGNGVSREYLKYTNKIKMNNETEKNRIVFVGRLVSHKNVFDVVKAAMNVRQKIKDLELAIISPGGPLEQKIIEYSTKFSFIKYYKNISDEDKIKIIKSSKVLVHTGSKEGFGLVLIESLACGTPFIAYNIPIMKEIAMETQGGMVVPYRDINKLSEKILEIIRNEELRLYLARTGLKNVADKFTWDKVARRYEKYIHKIRIMGEKY